MTSTSGLLKCLSATMPAKQAQSSMLPASARQCIVNLSAQTLRVRRSPTVILYSRWIARLFTRSPARIHNDSLSTASLRRKTLSSIRVIVTSSSEGLFPKQKNNRKMSVKKRRNYSREHTYLPTDFIFAWCHGRDLWMDWDCTFERSFRSGFDYFCGDICKDP